MRIYVCVKQVPETSGKVAVNPDGTLNRASMATINRLEKLGYVTLSERPVLRCREIKPAKLSGPLELNPEQKNCFRALSSQMESQNPGVALL